MNIKSPYGVNVKNLLQWIGILEKEWQDSKKKFKQAHCSLIDTRTEVMGSSN